MPPYCYCRKIKHQEPGETHNMRDGICPVQSKESSGRHDSSNIIIILRKRYRGMDCIGLAEDSCTKRYLENNNLSIPMDTKTSILLK
jgi:hypothetical protein